MRQITETYNVYTFDELSDKAKKKAIEEISEFVCENDWFDYIIEDFVSERLPERGFDNAKVYFSGFYCQGDGASFTADVDLTKFIESYEELYPDYGIKQELQREIEIEYGESCELCEDLEWHETHEDCSCNEPDIRNIEDLIDSLIIEREGRCSHSNTMMVKYGSDWSGYGYISRIERKESDGPEEYLAKIILEEARELAGNLYKYLEEEYDYLHTEAYAAEFSHGNEWEFHENGTRYFGN